jgi:hypothetical protein
VNHSAKEYVRGHVHTNSAEGLFSIFKRGTTEKHLHRYLTETSSATTTASGLGVSDIDRTIAAVRGRLVYRQPD